MSNRKPLAAEKFMRGHVAGRSMAAKVALLCGCLILRVLPLSWGVESTGQLPPPPSHFRSWKESHSQIRKRISSLSDQAQQIAATKSNQSSEFPDLFFLAIPIVSTTSEKQLLTPLGVKNAVAKAIRRLDQVAPEVCLSSSSGRYEYSKSAACQKYKEICEYTGLGTSDDGELVVSKLENNASISEQRISDLDQFKSWSTSTTLGSANFTLWDENLFYACYSLADIQVKLKATYFGHPNFDQLPEYVQKPVVWALTPDTFRQECIDKMPDGTQLGNLDRSLKEYPNDFTLRVWRFNLGKRFESCEKQASELCGTTFVIKDTRILSYPTVNCEIRDVTAADVQTDLQRFSTEADKLQHSVLRDTIEICDKAEVYGYKWAYTRPRVDPTCKPKSKT